MARPSATPRLFEQALRWFRQRTVTTDAEFDALEERARRRAFRIAGVSQLGMVQSVFDDIERAIRNGEDYDDFRKRVRLKLLRAWGTSQPYRIEAIFRTEIQKAYQAGRWRTLRSTPVRNLRPFWMFDAILDSRTSAICRNHNGTIRHQDDPYWDNYYPPLHVNCRSGVRALRRSDVARRGGVTDDVPTVPAQNGFGGPPDDAPEEPDLTNVDEVLQQEFRAKQIQGRS